MQGFGSLVFASSRATALKKVCLLASVCLQSPTVKSARSRLAGKKKPEVAWSEVVEGKGAAAEAGMRLADMATWQMNKGIAGFPKPAAWLNGAQVGP
jgi:hypothetical protein